MTPREQYALAYRFFRTRYVERVAKSYHTALAFAERDGRLAELDQAIIANARQSFRTRNAAHLNDPRRRAVRWSFNGWPARKLVEATGVNPFAVKGVLQ